MYSADYHVHSTFSPDGRQTVDDICRAALAAGLMEVCITDHTEANGWNPGIWYDFRIPRLMEELEAAREIYKGRLRVTFGTELGQQLEDPARVAEVLEESRYDFIIGSMHNIPGEPDFSMQTYAGEADCRAMLDRYFAALVTHAREAEYDALGHISYPLRYMRGQGVHVSFEDRHDELEAVLRAAIDRGRGIEVNTSGLRGSLGETMPALHVLRLYRELGGEIVTFGSDAHRMEDVGSGISAGQEMAREAGFRYFTVFRGRKPEFFAL